jgi:hypothetical protein
VPPVAVVDEVLDAAHVQPHRLGDPLDLRDDLGRRRVALDAHPGLRRVERARGARELGAVGRLAGVGGQRLKLSLG